MYTPRWKEIADAIGAQIDAGLLQSGDLLPSETDLAVQWNVSRMTAHRAMHELQQQGFVVRKRRVGTVVAHRNRRQTGHVAVFLNTRDFLEREYLAGIRAGLPDEYDLLCCDIRNEPQREAEYLERMSHKTDGILCLPTCDPRNTPQFQRLLEDGMPIVCVDCVPENLKIDAVMTDNYGGTLDALRFLAERGHRRIAHLTIDRLSMSSLRDRLQAYQEVMEEQGIPDASPWTRLFPFDMTRDIADLRQPMQDALFALLHRVDRPTALFCVNDYLLGAAIQACDDLAISVPDELEIVSFNDCPPLVPFAPGSVHRIVQRAYDMGQMAAERLCRHLQGNAGSSQTSTVKPLFYPAEAPVRLT